MSAGQRDARREQRWLTFYSIVLVGLAWWTDQGVDTAIICAFAMLSAVAVINAMRALARDGRP